MQATRRRVDVMASGAAPPRAAGRVPGEHLVVRLLVVLAAAAGSLDVLCLTQLGSVFASVITGNLVSFGGAVVGGHGTGAARAGLAVAAYALGVGIGSVVIGRGEGSWSRRSTVVAAAELALLVGVSGGWWAAAGRPATVAGVLMLGVSAAAMGMQSVVTMTSGVHGASTTYLTGTLTALVRGLVLRSGRPVIGDAVRLAALLVGALAGAAVLLVAPLWAPVLPTALVAGVVAVALYPHRQMKKEGS